MFANKNILVGVTGGIAAYKSCEIIREIKKNNGTVRVVMTQAATKFITPLTLATLSDNTVLQEMFDDDFRSTTIHIESARWADAILICPATANTIGKIANGIADNLLTTLVMAATVPVVLCPAMNKEMYHNPIYVQNAEKLKQLGYEIVDADEGELACGEFGEGRLAETHKILFALRKVLFRSNFLSGKRVLVTAGRTEEALDPVRFLTNRSSGKMGFALAQAAAISGAEVTLISGPTQLPPFSAGKFINVRSAAEMAEVIEKEYLKNDVIIMAAAVADFRPERQAEHKIKKSGAVMNLRLERTRDILQWLGERKAGKILVGFAVETEKELENARQKLEKKNLDMIVINNPLKPGAAFENDTNKVTIVTKNGKPIDLPLMSKIDVAQRIIEHLTKFFDKN